jgi:hypothetical protein
MENENILTELKMRVSKFVVEFFKFWYTFFSFFRKREKVYSVREKQFVI